MKLLVIQEQHFTEFSNGEVWVDKQSDVKFWDRYLDVFDEIVVCARYKKSYVYNTDGMLRSDRERVSFVPMPDFRATKGIIKNFFAIRSAIKKAIAMADCIIYRAPSPISMVAYDVVRKSKKPFAVELMNNPATHYSAASMHNFYQPILAKFLTNQTKSMCRNANGVAYVTKNVLQELYPSAYRLNNGNSNGKYFEAAYSTIRIETEDYKFNEWSKTLPSPIVFVHSGAMMDNRKGQDLFIEVIAELNKRGYNSRGILIGDGCERDRFEKLGNELGISDKLDFTGWKSGFNAVQQELLKGHIFVFPSTGEGLPRSIIEAMATGMICVGSKIDGVVELLNEELLVEDFSAKAFVEVIVKLLDNWDDTLEYRTVLYERAKEYEYSKLRILRKKFYTNLNECAKR